MQLLLIIFAFYHGVQCFVYPKVVSGRVSGPEYGDPVFVTDYINSGEIDWGRKACEVPPMKKNISSYAGFFTVNQTYNSNMYFWFFPAETEPEKAPVVLWLQGGPGASSLIGLFGEIGPYFITKNKGLQSRKHYWSQVLNVIYIDNPVGTGFSFTNDDAGYARNEEDVGNNLYEAVRQFFVLFPMYKSNKFYIAGESYAGKYVPALAYTIDANNRKTQERINLKGLAIGNGFCDPENMMNYGDYLIQLGLLELNEKSAFGQYQRTIVHSIKQKKFGEALKAFDQMLYGDLTTYKSLFYNSTGYEFNFNFLHTSDYSTFGDMGPYLQKDWMRRDMHVGTLPFQDGGKVVEFLKRDIMQSIKPWFEDLIKKYRILVYNGQMDIIVPYPLTSNFLNKLYWTGRDGFATVKKKHWFVDGQLAGYSKTAGRLTHVLVRGAGHMVPMDKPKWALDLITRFTSKQKF